MCEVDCPRALLKIFKLPLPFGGVSRCVMFAGLPRWWCRVWWCLGGASASLVALCVCVLCCVFVCVYARASASALCVRV